MTTAARAYTTMQTPITDGGSAEPTWPTAWTLIEFEGVRFDTGGLWSASTPTRLTVPSGGYYYMGFVFDMANAENGITVGAIYRNGEGDLETDVPLVSRSYQEGSGTRPPRTTTADTDYYLEAGDYIELRLSTDHLVGPMLSGMPQIGAELWVARHDE